MNDQHAGLVNWSHSIGLCFCPSCKKKTHYPYTYRQCFHSALTRHTAISHSLHGETQSHTALTPKTGFLPELQHECALEMSFTLILHDNPLPNRGN